MLPRFGYLRPATLEEAVRALADYGAEARVLAGGTDLLVSMKDGLTRPKYLIDIKRIPELRRLEVTGDGTLKIGSCVTVNELREYGGLPKGMAAVRQAASWLGTNQVRNRATVGGNLCNASPACDLGPAMLVLDAKLKARSVGGDRTVELKDFFTCPKETCLLKHELVSEIVVPAADGKVSRFAKRTRIRGHDLAVVNAAASVVGGRLKLALGAVAPTPLLLDAFAGIGLEDEEGIVKVVLASISPIDDVRGSGAYRRSMVGVLVRNLVRGLKTAAEV